MEITQLIFKSLIFIFPAYCANALPVITGGGRPLDFGKLFFDGNPVLGRNKTFRGFFSGLILGATVGFLESVFFDFPIFFGLVLSLGALFGDLTGSFIKRRLKMTAGELFPVMDQIDFVVGALLLSHAVSFDLHWELTIMVLLVTPPLHLLTNFTAYKFGLKNRPW